MDRENPAWWQCAVTALVFQDELGGETVCASAMGPRRSDARRHFRNRLPSGAALDLTQQQFPENTTLSNLTTVPRTRILNAEKYSDICRRYKILKRLVRKCVLANRSESGR